MKEIERRPRIACIVADTEPAIIVSGVQDRCATVSISPFLHWVALLDSHTRPWILSGTPLT
jgi:hypothetical protein